MVSKWAAPSILFKPGAIVRCYSWPTRIHTDAKLRTRHLPSLAGFCTQRLHTHSLFEWPYSIISIIYIKFMNAFFSAAYISVNMHTHERRVQCELKLRIWHWLASLRLASVEKLQKQTTPVDWAFAELSTFTALHTLIAWATAKLFGNQWIYHVQGALLCHCVARLLFLTDPLSACL